MFLLIITGDYCSGWTLYHCSANSVEALRDYQWSSQLMSYTVFIIYVLCWLCVIYLWSDLCSPLYVAAEIRSFQTRQQRLSKRQQR